MPRNFCLSLALVLAPAVVFSQAAASSAPPADRSSAGQGFVVTTMTHLDGTQTTSVSPGVVLHGDCPVSMSAHQMGMGELVAVAPGQPSKPDPGPAQRLRLTLGARNGNSVASARVVVHGLDGKSALRNIDNLGSGSGEANRTLTVSFTTADSSHSSARLVARGLTAVRWIELDSITYADGATWTAKPGACRIEPDSVMLIGQR